MDLSILSNKNDRKIDYQMDILSDVSIQGNLNVKGSTNINGSVIVSQPIVAIDGITINNERIIQLNNMIYSERISGMRAVFTEFMYYNISTDKTFNVFCQNTISVPSGCSKFNIGEPYHNYPVVTAYDYDTGCKVEIDLYFCRTTKTLQASRADTSASKTIIFSYMN